MFKKATKDQIKIRLAISGASGSGKTFSSLAIAWGLKQLPGIPRSKLEAEFASLAPTNGKKSPAWVERVRSLAKF